MSIDSTSSPIKTAADLYKQLGTSGDSEGLAYWQSRLDSGEKLSSVANAFQGSANSVLSTQLKNTAPTADLYKPYVQTTADGTKSLTQSASTFAAKPTAESIKDYISKNTNISGAQLQAEMTKLGATVEDIGHAYGMYDNASKTGPDVSKYDSSKSMGLNYATVAGTPFKGGEDQYYANIVKFLDDGHTNTETAAAQLVYGVSDADIAEAKKRKAGAQVINLASRVAPNSSNAQDVLDATRANFFDRDMPRMDNEWTENRKYATDTAGLQQQIGQRALKAYDDYVTPALSSYKALADKWGNKDYQAKFGATQMEATDAQYQKADEALQRQFQGLGLGSGKMVDAMAAQAADRARARVAAAGNEFDFDAKRAAMLGSLGGMGLQASGFGNTTLNSGVTNQNSTFGQASDIANTGVRGGTAISELGAKLPLYGAQVYSTIKNADANWQNAQSTAQNANTNQASSSVDPWQAAGSALLQSGIKTVTSPDFWTGLKF